MRIINLKINLFLITLFTLFTCSNDDDLPTVELRDRGEQQITDKDLIITYLNTHYFDENLFINNPNTNFTIDDIVLEELADGETQAPVGKTLLINSSLLQLKTTTFEDVVYDYYILNINQGGGEYAPRFTDDVRLNYEGSLMTDASVFDSTATPATFDIVNDFLIRGWSLVIPEFNPAASFVDNGDGTETYNDAGLGVMFLPSGLSYFGSAVVGVPAYSNLIFKFNLFTANQNDHDNDGIPSYIEDLDNDINVFDDDTDGDAIVNYADGDDDGDGISTFDEHILTTYTLNLGDPEPTLGPNDYQYSRTLDDATNITTIEIITLVDSDNNGEFDYLESSIAVDNNTSND